MSTWADLIEDAKRGNVFAVDPAVAESKWGAGKFVSMNDHARVNRTERIYTIGMCGCNGVLARKGDEILLCHQDPMGDHFLLRALEIFAPEEVWVWTPGEWERQPDGKYGNVPVGEPIRALQRFKPRTIGYSLMRGHGDSPISIEFNNGRITAFNMTYDDWKS